MTKLKTLSTLVVFSLFSAISFAQISGTSHDFSGETWNTSGEICIVCHTPHRAMTGVADAPLWNHATTTSTFTLYTSGTMDGATGQPTGSSKLCLSCHDGTVALENYGGVTNGTSHVSVFNTVGPDLSNDHPISFTYDAALASTDGGLHNPSTTNSGLGSTINDDLLISGKMQCSSCHDVHGTAHPSLLRKSNAASALCLTCHNK